MRILSLNMSEFLGGLEMISETYFRELRRRGVDISFLLLRDSLLHRRFLERFPLARILYVGAVLRRKAAPFFIPCKYLANTLRDLAISSLCFYLVPRTV